MNGFNFVIRQTDLSTECGLIGYVPFDQNRIELRLCTFVTRQADLYIARKLIGYVPFNQNRIELRLRTFVTQI